MFSALLLESYPYLCFISNQRNFSHFLLNPMELIYGLHHFRPEHRHCIATIGNFDGVHCGHQAIFKKLKQKADALGLPVVVVIFEPQPQEFFSKDQPIPRLTRLREKLTIMNEYGVDRVVCLRFNDKLAALQATEFIESILIERLAVKFLLVGPDFRFGQRRQGDLMLLKQYGRKYGFEVDSLEPTTCQGKRVSSTWIRNLLQAGDLKQAQALLGHHYRMSGRVVHGDKRGRELNIPTANIHIQRKYSPILGVYAVEVFGISQGGIKGVANIGHRPTVGGTQTLLEVHLFNFDQDIYGQYVDVDFLHKLRDEERFDSFERLKQQINQDIKDAKAFFHHNH